MHDRTAGVMPSALFRFVLPTRILLFVYQSIRTFVSEKVEAINTIL
jgi:hypothetical protein